MTDELKQDYTRRISSANPTELSVVIYDIVLAYAGETRHAIDIGDTGLINNSVNNIRRCINELIASLHYEYPLAGDLLRIYKYCISLLSKARINKDKEAVEEIIAIITKLRDSYAQVASHNESGSVMNNSESVYAGLTYGRGSLNESVIGSGNRGFLA